MTTEAQVQANRANAQKSTGPRSPEGKATVSENAVKHGLSGRRDVIKGEDQAEFDRHREALLKELAPDGAVEAMLAERVVSLSWRLQRVGRMQNEVFDALLADGATPLAKLVRSMAGKKTEDDEGLALGRATIKDFANSRVLDRLLMYERRMESSLLKTLNDLHVRRLRVREYISRHMDEIGAEPAGGVPVRASWCKDEDGGTGSEGPASPDPAGAFSFKETPAGVTTNIPDGPDADKTSATRIAQTSNIPSSQDSADEAESSCKTKPIAGEGDAEPRPADGDQSSWATNLVSVGQASALA